MAKLLAGSLLSMEFIHLKGKTMKLASLARKFAPSVTLSAFLLFLVAFQSPFEASGSPLLQVEKAHHAVWEVNNYNMKSEDLCGEKRHSRGTAFAISPNIFVTDFHVLSGFLSRCSDIEGISLRQENNSVRLKVRRILAVSATYDLALFEIKGNVENYLNFAEVFSLERERQPLSVVGYLKHSVNRVRQVEEIRL